MLDLAGITISGIIMMLIIVRAAQLDRSLPWFQKIERKAASAGPSGDRGGRTGPTWRRKA